jgi:type IV pilus assembly protein PilY1
MQMMKTAATNAFLTMDSAEDIASNVSRFRLGYMSINNNTQADFLNLEEFKTSQKYNWYLKLVSANPSNSTPLRKALATAGKYYAGVLDGTTLNGSAVVDPLQYSCQQNYTILSTDGFWNEGSGYTKLDGSTSVGNQDVGLQRPYYDGGSAQLQTRTSTLQQRTGALQIRTFSGGRRGSWSSWSNTSSCTPVSGSAECRYNWSSWTNVSSCTVSQNTASDSVWNISNGTDCQYANWTSWANTTSCTIASQSVAPNYTVGLARDCQTISSSGGSSNSLADVAAYYYNTDLRNSSASAPDATGTCTGPTIAPSTTPNDLCANNVPANGRDVATTQHMTTFTLGLGSQGQMIYSPMDGKDYWNDTSGDFFDVLKGNTADSASGICSWQSSGACNWPTPSSNSNANIDDLWHAAINGHGAYFSASDPASLSSSLTNTLSTIVNTPRPGTAAAAASSNPNVSASDNYVFSSSYKSVDWYGELIRQQITTSGALTAQNWSARKLLDCATTSWTANTSYIVGDAYRNSGVCYYVTAAYSSGSSFNQGVDGANTVVVNNDETAETKTPATPQTSRNIYTNNGGRLVSFQWTDPANPPSNPNSLSDAQKAYFTRPVITYVAPPSGQSSYAGLSQFCSSGGNCLSTTQQTAAEGAALVNYLRGDRTNEGTYFRKRAHVLGDIVSSEARYVQTPMFNYTDTNYGAYKTAKASRAGRVYVGSNDGMLHAFDAATGQEVWAYIPSFVLPQLYKLADKQYSTNHQYFVDGTPETGDICPNAPSSTCTAGQWKTILVGGLNLGGKGYYALDITDPAAPQLLWEFTDANMGYTYGNPTITKLEDGTWVVLISSGYNNADGVGRLYILNANSGTLIRTISTGAGSASSPSGLSRISAHVLQPMTNNMSRAAYGGDMFGNLWRFDINGDIGASGYDAQLLVTVKGPNNETQPITVKPVQATINGKPVVFAGTGRFLGVSDVSDTSTESFYAVKDDLDTVTFGNPRLSSSNFVQQTLSVGTCPADAPTTVCQPSQEVRLSTSNPVDWSSKNGWYLDFVTGGERSSTDPSLALGTLLFTTITPQASSGSACGPTTGTAASFIYALNYLTGAPVNGAFGVSGISLGSGLVTRPVMIEQADGTVRALVRTPATSNAGNGTDDGSTIVTTPPIDPAGGGATRRVSWRVLSN